MVSPCASLHFWIQLLAVGAEFGIAELLAPLPPFHNRVMSFFPVQYIQSVWRGG